MAKRNGAAIESDIINSHNAGMFRNWEARKSELRERWDLFPDESFNPYPHKSSPVPWRANDLVVENRQEFDLVHALEDSGQEKQYEFDFEYPQEKDPEDRFHADIRPGQEDL